jgi:hypothetical protein
VASRLVRVVLYTALVCSTVFLVMRLRDEFYWPGNQQDYEPVQPIAFSHQQHAGKLEIACLYCHTGAEASRHAGIPAAELCMNCHRLVTAGRAQVVEAYATAERTHQPAQPPVSPELQKLYDALGLDKQLQPDPKKTPTPISWVKVYNLPSFSCFDHRPHVHAGVACQQCHGPVETMDRVRQVGDLSMGWCVKCHRESGLTGESLAAKAGRKAERTRPSTDCAACHY